MWKYMLFTVSEMPHGFGSITKNGIEGPQDVDGWHFFKKTTDGITDVYITCGRPDGKPYYANCGVRHDVADNKLKRPEEEEHWPIWFHLINPQSNGHSVTMDAGVIYWPYRYSEDVYPETPISFIGKNIHIANNMVWNEGWFMWPTKIGTKAYSSQLNFDPLNNKCLDDPLLKCQFSTINNDVERYKLLVGDDIPF